MAANSAIVASAITAAATTKTEFPNSSGGRIGWGARRSTTASSTNDPAAARASPSTGAEDQA